MYNVKFKWWVYEFFISSLARMKILIKSCKIENKMKNITISMLHLWKNGKE